MASELTARISVVLTSEMRDAFFDFCRRQEPRVSMSERLVQHIRADLGENAPPAKPKKRHTPRPAPAGKPGKRGTARPK